MKKIVELLTNEKLRHLFDNNFDLANFAIKMARTRIERNQSTTLSDILAELNLMAEGKKEVKIEEAQTPERTDYE